LNREIWAHIHVGYVSVVGQLAVTLHYDITVANLYAAIAASKNCLLGKLAKLS